MAVIETWYNQDLQQPVKVHYLDGSMFSHNGNGNRIGVRVYNDGEPVTLTGKVSGYVITSDGSTVPCVGARSGNEATITIPPAAYQPGNAFITIFLTDGSTVTTLCAAQTTVLQARTGSQVSPGSVVQDWTQTINAAMQDVQTAADNLGGIVATPYASLTYPVPLGKYTYYNGNLYRCISPIAESEEFTAAHWAQVRLGDEVTDLKDALNTVTVLPEMRNGSITNTGNNTNVAFQYIYPYHDATRIKITIDRPLSATGNYYAVLINTYNVNNGITHENGTNRVTKDKELDTYHHVYITPDMFDSTSVGFSVSFYEKTATGTAVAVRVASISAGDISIEYDYSDKTTYGYSELITHNKRHLIPVEDIATKPEVIGVESLRWVATKTASDTANNIIFPRFDVSEDDTIVAGCDYMDGFGTRNFRADALNASGTVLQQWWYGKDVVSGKSVMITVPKGTAKLEIRFMIQNNGTGESVPTLGETYRIDNAFVYKYCFSKLKLEDDIYAYIGNKRIPIDYINRYIATNGQTVDRTELLATTGGKRLSIVSCAEGDIFTINAIGNDDAKPWCFISSTGEILSIATSNTYNKYTVSAPVGSAYLIINNTDQTKQSYYGGLLPKNLYYYPVAYTLPEIIVPKKSFAVVGHEWNMYYENIVDNLNLDTMYVYCSSISGAKYYKRFLRWTPTAQDIGTKTVKVSVYNRKSRELITEKSFTLVVSADSPTNKKVIFIGDSLTQNGIYPHEIQYELSNGKYVSVGTITATDVSFTGETVAHEGRGGWSPNTYVTQYEYMGKTNAFWNPSTSAFDFTYYMNQNGFSGIDCVMLNIGTNGMSHIGDSVSAVNQMIASIHEYDENLPIIISLIIPPNDQNSGGYHYGDWDSGFYKMSQMRYVKRFISEYDGTIANVYLSEPYFNMDTDYDYPSTSVTASSRNPTEITIHSDPLHPNQYGYLKMADVYYQNLIARLES